MLDQELLLRYRALVTRAADSAVRDLPRFAKQADERTRFQRRKILLDDSNSQLELLKFVHDHGAKVALQLGFEVGGALKKNEESGDVQDPG